MNEMISLIVEASVTTQKVAKDVLGATKKVNRLTKLCVAAAFIGGLALRNAYVKLANLNERLINLEASLGEEINGE